MTYRVCVDRPRDATPSGVRQLAEAIAERFDVAPGKVVKRLQSGRLTVCSLVDRETAKRLAVELERLGAVCSLIEEARGARGPAPSEFQSGLSAALSGGVSDQAVSLGALEDVGAEATGDRFRLATLDGAEEDAASPANPTSFAPPSQRAGAREGASARAAPTRLPPSPPKPPRSEKPQSEQAWAGADPFAPPPTGERELELDAERGLPPTARADLPAATSAPPVPSQGVASSTPAAASPSRPVPAPRGAPPAARAGLLGAAREGAGRARDALAARPRVRFAAGLLLAVLLGFVPAHFVSTARERSAYGEVDDELRATYEQLQLVEPDEAQVEALWKNGLDQKRTARQNIAITGVFLWLATGAGVAFLWFRRIDWAAPPVERTSPR